MKPRYHIELPGKMEIPTHYTNIVEVFSIAKKLFDHGHKFCVIKQNGDFLQKLVNPKYRQVTNDEWLDKHTSGNFRDAFIINENGQNNYYIKD